MSSNKYVNSSDLKITFCNKAYADGWFKNLRRNNKQHFSILKAILHEIRDKDGKDIVKADLLKKYPIVASQIETLHLDIIPSRGQMLMHNGNGIRHAKFAPSKSIAVIWEKIDDIIYVTFDDHAPIRYHRAISHLRDIKLGKQSLPRQPRNRGKFLKKLKLLWKNRFSKELKGFDPKRRYYE